METDLRGQVLVSADLSGADLAGADLSDAKLHFAKLVGTRLAHATLRRANLAGADLTDADFTGADLRGASLRDVKLRGAVLEGVHHDDLTVWPVGFTPPPSVGAYKVEETDPPRAPHAARHAPPAGWFPDPWCHDDLRWWDGTGWTSHLAGRGDQP